MREMELKKKEISFKSIVKIELRSESEKQKLQKRNSETKLLIVKSLRRKRIGQKWENNGKKKGNNKDTKRGEKSQASKERKNSVVTVRQRGKNNKLYKEGVSENIEKNREEYV